MMRRGSTSSSHGEIENDSKFQYDLRMEEIKMRQEQLRNKFNRLKVLYQAKCKALKAVERELRKTKGVVSSAVSMREKKRDQRLRRRSRSAPLDKKELKMTPKGNRTIISPTIESVKVEDDISRFRSPSFGGNRRRRNSEDSENGDIQLPTEDQINDILLEGSDMTDSKNETSSLIDHFIVVGLPSSRDWCPESLSDSTKPSSLASLNGRWKPQILYQHLKSVDASRKYSRLAEFCLPNGAEVRVKSKSNTSTTKPRLHTFMLSGGDEAVYGICLIVSQPLESVDEFVRSNKRSSPLRVKSVRTTVKAAGEISHHMNCDVAAVPDIVLPPSGQRSPTLTLFNNPKRGNSSPTKQQKSTIPKTSNWVSSLFTSSPSRAHVVTKIDEKEEEEEEGETKDEDDDEEKYFAETDRCYCILARYPLYSVYASILSVILKLASLDRDDRKDNDIVTCSHCKTRNVCPDRASIVVCHRCGTALQNPKIFQASTPITETFRFENQGSLGLVLASYDPPSSCKQQYSAVVSRFVRASDGTLLPAEDLGKIQKGSLISKVNGKSTKGISYDDVIAMFKSNERPLSIEFVFMQPKRPPHLQILQNNNHITTPQKSPGSPSCSSDDEFNKPEFSPRGTRLRNLRRRLRDAKRRHSIPTNLRCDDGDDVVDGKIKTINNKLKMSLEEILDSLLSHEPSVRTLQRRGLSHALPESLRKYFTERLNDDDDNVSEREEDDEEVEDAYDGLDSRLSRGHFGEFESHTLWTVAVTLCTFNANQIVSVLCNLLLERQLCVYSEDVKMLSPISMSLILMLRPFVWQSTFIPSLPLSMIMVLQAPVPFLVGTMCSLDLNRWPDVTFANVDERQVHLSHDMPEMPFQSALLSRLNASIERLESILRRRHYKSCEFGLALSYEARECINDTLLMLRAYFTVMLGDIRAHCMRDVTSTSPSDLVFMKQIYVESCNARYREFVSQFLDTQIFTEYFDSHIPEKRRLSETTVD